MKTIKYLVMGVVLAGFSTTTMAQDGTSADIDALKSVIKSKPADYSKQVKNFINCYDSHEFTLNALIDKMMGKSIRSIVSAENKFRPDQTEVKFSLKPYKVFLFDRESEERV